MDGRNCGQLHQLGGRISLKQFTVWSVWCVVHATGIAAAGEQTNLCSRAQPDASGKWRDHACDNAIPALCGTPSTSVSVSLPAEAGAVSPKCSSSNTVTVQLTPPVPTISLSSPLSSPTTDSVIVFAVSFSTDVQGLSASSFDIEAPRLGVISSLTGSSRDYVLTITITSTSSVCPIGYTRSADGMFCAKYVSSPTSHAAAEAACAPYYLASVHSSDQQSFLTSLTSSSTWSVCLLH